MLVGIDIDNVLAEFEAAFRGWINRHTGLALKRSDITRYRFAECCGLSPEEVAELFAGFVGAGQLRRLRLIPHARAALDGLARRAEICLVTSRPPREEIVADTLFWVGRKGLPYSELLWSERKWEVAGGFSLFIEDNLEQALGLAERGVEVLLLDYPWNRTAPPHPNITRIRSWHQVASCHWAGTAPSRPTP
jgi:uncharacterized HAD superfamily protein